MHVYIHVHQRTERVREQAENEGAKRKLRGAKGRGKREKMTRGKERVTELGVGIQEEVAAERDTQLVGSVNMEIDGDGDRESGRDITEDEEE